MHTHGTQRAVSCRILFLHVFKPTYFGQESLGAKYCKHSYKIKYYFRWTSSSIKFLFVFFFFFNLTITRNFEVIESKFRDIKPRILLLDSILSCYLFIYLFLYRFLFWFCLFQKKTQKGTVVQLVQHGQFLCPSIHKH